MTEQYKTGEIVIVQHKGREPVRAFAAHGTSMGDVFVTANGDNLTMGHENNTVLRRLAVIDPENDDDMRRFADLVKTNLRRGDTSHKQDLKEALRDYAAPVVSPAEALYNESKCDGEKPWADLLPETRHGWEYAARTLAEFSNDAKEDPEALPKRYERPDAGEATITDGEGDTLRMERPSDEDDDRRFFITSSGGAYIRRDQFRQLVADLTPWMNGADS